MIPLLIVATLLQQPVIRPRGPVMMAADPVVSLSPDDSVSIGFCASANDAWTNFVQEDKWYVVRIDGVQQPWAGYPTDDTTMGWPCYYLPSKIYKFTVGQHYFSLSLVVPASKIPPDAPGCPPNWAQCCNPGVDCVGDPGTIQVNCVVNPPKILAGPPPAILGLRLVQ